jgi:hypothetical protein
MKFLKTLQRVAALLIALFPTGAQLYAQTPDGRAFRVNSIAHGQQRGAVVNMDGAGRGMVLWTDFNQEPSGLAHPRIVGQGFSPQGLHLGKELLSNAPPFEADGVGGLVNQGNARFMTIWGQGFSYYARPFLVNGEPDGAQVLLDQSGSQVGYFDYPIGYGAGNNGEFVGVWSRSTGKLFATWFDRNGNQLCTVDLPSIVDASGEFLVDVVGGPNRSVLLGYVTPGFNQEFWDLYVQAYSNDGAKLGPPFLFPHNIGSPEAGMAWNSLTRNFVVAWYSAEPSSSGYIHRILFQRLSLQGQPLTEEPTVISETGGIPAAVACNNKGFCAVTWFREQVGIIMRIVRPDGTVLPTEVLVAAVPAYPNWVAYGGNGALMVVWTDDYSSATDPADIAARRLIASPGDEVCQRVGNEVRCDSGRTGSLPELRLASFGLDRRDKLLFGDADGDGRADPCRVRSGVWRCDTDHEGGATETVLGFAGAASGTPLLGDLDGNGRAEACSWSAGILTCDTARNGGAPELSLFYGRNGETPLLGDLDGDGRDDLCMASKGSLRCDVGHDGGRTEVRFALGLASDQYVLGDFDGNGTDDPCLVRAGKLLCDTAHDGGAPDAELLLAAPGIPTFFANLDGV